MQCQQRRALRHRQVPSYLALAPKCPFRAIYLATHFNNFYDAEEQMTAQARRSWRWRVFALQAYVERKVLDLWLHLQFRGYGPKGLTVNRSAGKDCLRWRQGERS